MHLCLEGLMGSYEYYQAGYNAGYADIQYW